MKKLLLLLLVVAACKKTKIPECEDLVKTAEKIEKCEKIPADKRAEIRTGTDQIRNALKLLEDVGDQAEQSQLDGLAKTCKQQNETIRDLYQKVAPECLK
jgi:hypothetical protein